VESEKQDGADVRDVGVSVAVMHKWECLRKTGRGWKVKNKMARR